MKKLLQVITMVFISAKLFGQAVPNGGFENWTNFNWSDPTGYFTSDDQFVPYGWASNVTQVSGYHGKFGVALMTTKVGADTTQAYVANGNPTNNPASGGTPYSQKPTGIRFYYQCNVKAGDTSVVLALFKKGGVDIGIYEFKITGNVGFWTLYSKNFVPALSITPDTVVFGAIASIGILKNKNGIPGTQFIIDSVSFTGVASQPVAMNGDFENWTPMTATYPTGWSGSYPGVVQTVDKYAGNYALEVMTTSNLNNGAQPGFATTGKVTPNNNSGNLGGYPYTLTTDTLSFYYKYAPVGGDTAQVSINLKKGGSSVGGYGMPFFTTVSSYTLAKIGFTNGTAPDSVIVTVSSSQNYNTAGKHVGSVFKVDNMQFKSQPLAVDFITLPEGAVKVYPNPTTGMLNIDTHDLSGTVQAIQVFDMSGRMISSTNYTDLKTGLTTFNMSECATGLYLLHISTSEGSYFQKINKQ